MTHVLAGNLAKEILGILAEYFTIITWNKGLYDIKFVMDLSPDDIDRKRIEIICGFLGETTDIIYIYLNDLKVEITDIDLRIARLPKESAIKIYYTEKVKPIFGLVYRLLSEKRYRFTADSNRLIKIYFPEK